MRAARTVVLTAASALAVTGISVAPAAAAPDVRMAPAPVEEVLEHVTDFGMLYGMAGIGDQLFVSEAESPIANPYLHVYDIDGERTAVPGSPVVIRTIPYESGLVLPVAPCGGYHFDAVTGTLHAVGGHLGQHLDARRRDRRLHLGRQFDLPLDERDRLHRDRSSERRVAPVGGGRARRAWYTVAYGVSGQFERSLVRLDGPNLVPVPGTVGAMENEIAVLGDAIYYLHFDGTFFRVVPGETPEEITDVPAASNPISLGSYLGVSSTDQQHFYLLDENGLVEDGPNGDYPAGAGEPVELDGDWYLLGGSGYGSGSVWRFDGTGFTILDPAPAEPDPGDFVVLATAGGALYAAGNSGGTLWSHWPNGAPVDPGEAEPAAPTLPDTGAAPGIAVAAGLALLFAGAAAVAIRRRTALR